MPGPMRFKGNEAAPRSPLILPRRHVLAGAGVVAGAIALGDLRAKSSFAATKPAGVLGSELSSNLSSPTNAMYIVAHPDDSLLFQSPSLLQNVQNGLNVLTVHLTAGDDGLAESYWGDRELGIEAAYALMAGAANNWTTSALTVGSHQIVLDTLKAQPNITVAFMRLPDGGYPAGDGTPMYGNQSLMQLWQGSESSITAVDGSTSYVSQDLINTLASMMTTFQPQLIVVQDYVNTFGDGDHMDHYATAQFAQSAHNLYATTHSFVGYMGYSITALAANVSGALLTTKQSAFYTYGGYDSLTCSSQASCASTAYAPWLLRQYIVGSVPAIDMPIASAGSNQVVGLGASVELDGSASSDPNNQSLTYYWTQTAGPTVTLSNPGAVQPTFTAPASSQTMIFSLVVTNSTEVSAASLVTISSGTASNFTLVAGSTSSTKAGTTGAITVTSPQNVTSSGNVLLAMVQVFGPNSTGVGTVSDTRTGTWAALGQTTVSGNVQFVLWQCTNPQAGVAHVVTWTPSAADTWGGLVVMAEWVGGPFTLDKMSSVLTSKATSGATPSVTPSIAGELVLASAADENGTSAWTSPTNSFTSLTTPDSANVMAYLLDSATSPISTSWSVSPSDSGVTAIFALSQGSTATAYTVTFNGNGSTSGSMANETASGATNLTTNAFIRTGYTFAGWNTVASGVGGTSYADDASYPFTSSATLYAQWTAVSGFTVTFSGNGSTGGSMANETASVATNLTTNAFTRTGYTFAGWNTVPSGVGGTSYADDASYPFTSSTTLYAQWSTPSAIALVSGSTSSTKVGTTGAITVTSALNVASSANVLLAMVQVFGPNSTGMGSISDTKTGTWTALGQTTVSGDTQFVIWQCTNPQAGVKHAITWTPSAADKWGSLVVMSEWTGGPFTLDKTSSVLAAKGTSGATPSVTPSTTGELVLASAADEIGTSAWTSPTKGFTALATPDSANVMAYLLDSTASAINTAWSVSPSDSGVTAIFALY